ncbi:MAG TPA: hypothetical protein VFT91_05965 [Dehalococcoidia bacterium]|nr:hypothetical protein [Dehalococcoidia bacterium]
MSILIDERTTFIIQGITGREAVNMTRECLASFCHAERPRGSRVARGIFAKASGAGPTAVRGTFCALERGPR